MNKKQRREGIGDAVDIFLGKVFAIADSKIQKGNLTEEEIEKSLEGARGLKSKREDLVDLLMDDPNALADIFNKGLFSKSSSPFPSLTPLLAPQQNIGKD